MYPNLRSLMCQRGIRLFHLSAHLRASDGYVSARLCGRRPFAPHERTRLAEFFSVPEDWLFTPLTVPPLARRETASFAPAMEAR